ncbi:hypothetical protein DLAC_10253 [Tieghemostelium lacteum]|uniref:Beta-adaptin appendage C-terminal subdomain domain-containing protein n=1 Tax=Tieghemostelium lacteum TaxID=361077 RepID=A0A151Z4Z3_TIELA|nr:hypothetical protein DLAC_10253 [Tieghemostelium lacteum]|eukprot:KYQ89030.1 hypothetical protein DLAC_10253 [Tieghemostelium lacteum]
MTISCEEHSKSFVLCCISCRKLLCTKCLANHSTHEIKDTDDYYKELEEQSEKLKEEPSLQFKLFNEIKAKKEYDFQEHVRSHHDKQMGLIDGIFKELHDQLHIKQVDLKKQLKSHHDENSELHCLKISHFENQITQQQNFLSLLDSQDTYQNDKINYIQKYFEQITISKNSNNNNNNNNKKNKTTDSEFYNILTLDNTSTSRILDQILLIIFNQGRVVFRLANQGVEKQKYRYTWAKNEILPIITLENGATVNPDHLKLYLHFAKDKKPKFSPNSYGLDCSIHFTNEGYALVLKLSTIPSTTLSKIQIHENQHGFLVPDSFVPLEHRVGQILSIPLVKTNPAIVPKGNNLLLQLVDIKNCFYSLSLQPDIKYNLKETQPMTREQFQTIWNLKYREESYEIPIHNFNPDILMLIFSNNNVFEVERNMDSSKFISIYYAETDHSVKVLVENTFKYETGNLKIHVKSSSPHMLPHIVCDLLDLIIQFNKINY